MALMPAENRSVLCKLIACIGEMREAARRVFFHELFLLGTSNAGRGWA